MALSQQAFTYGPIYVQFWMFSLLFLFAWRTHFLVCSPPHTVVAPLAPCLLHYRFVVLAAPVHSVPGARPNTRPLPPVRHLPRPPVGPCLPLHPHHRRPRRADRAHMLPARGLANLRCAPPAPPPSPCIAAYPGVTRAGPDWDRQTAWVDGCLYGVSALFSMAPDACRCWAWRRCSLLDGCGASAATAFCRHF